MVAFDTRLGCLDPNLSSDSEAQKMIDAARYSGSALAEIEFSVPVWKLYKTKKMRKLYEAQDFVAELAIESFKCRARAEVIICLLLGRRSNI